MCVRARRPFAPPDPDRLRYRERARSRIKLMRAPARHLAALLLLPALLAPSGSARSQSRAAWSARLDPRLAAAIAGGEPVAVWVEFADKGETGPSDLAARLAAAERSLTP